LLAERLNQIMNALAVLDEQESRSSKPITKLSEQEIGALMARLITLLKEDDADAIEVLETLAPAFSESDAAKEVQRVIACVERYEFDTALEKLNNIEFLANYMNA